MRLLSEVAQQIQDVVPEEHEEKFARLTKDFSYEATEQIGGCWVRLSMLCNELLDNKSLSLTSEDWQVEMIAILTMKDKEELLAAAH